MNIDDASKELAGLRVRIADLKKSLNALKQIKNIKPSASKHAKARKLKAIAKSKKKKR